MTLGKLASILTLIAITLSCDSKSTINYNPDLEVPIAPSNLRAVAISPSEINLSWRDNSTNEDFFAIYRYDRETAAFVILGRTGVNIAAYSDIDVEDSTEYMYYIVAENGDTTSDRSNLATAITFVEGMFFVGSLQGSFPNGKIALGNGSVFIGCSDSIITSIDIQFPQNPIIDQRFQAPGEIHSLMKSNNNLVLGIGLGGMLLVSAYNPASLETLGRCYTPNSTLNATAEGGYVYAIDNSGLCVIDAADPANPSLITTFSNGAIATVNALCADGNFVYLACGDSGLQVINAVDRRYPEIVGRLDTPGSAKDLVKQGQYIFLADGIGGLKIIDVLYPHNPLLMATYTTSGEVTAVSVDGSLAYIADSQTGLFIVDIGVINFPLYAAMYRSPGRILSLAANDGVAYLNIAGSGLMILRFDP
jgi:hypothetical protein